MKATLSQPIHPEENIHRSYVLYWCIRCLNFLIVYEGRLFCMNAPHRLPSLHHLCARDEWVHIFHGSCDNGKRWLCLVSLLVGC